MGSETRVTELLRDEHGYTGSVDLVRKRLAELRPKTARPEQKTAYRPGQVMQVDWGEMPTRPRVLGRERRVYALVCTLPFSGASTAHFTFDPQRRAGADRGRIAPRAAHTPPPPLRGRMRLRRLRRRCSLLG
jgi:transposase